MSIEPVLETIHEMLARARAREGSAFDPSASPLYRQAIFVVGAPRSGTTWLHQLLATHPDVATGGEAHVFCEGVSALLRNHEDPDPHMMLSTWLPRGEMLTLVRALTDGIFDTARRFGRPGATRVLDKTPDHVAYAADAAEVYPDATYIHIVRDGRDSASSQRDLWAGVDDRLRSWDVAAGGWRDAVLDARRHLSSLDYHEVRYEDLVREPEKRFTELLEAARLPYDDAYVEKAIAFGRAPINVRPSDAGVGVRKWEGRDPGGERQIVLAVGDLLVELGYLEENERARIVSDRTWPETAREASAALRSLAGRLGRRARRTVDQRRRRGATPATRRSAASEWMRSAMSGDPASVRLAPGGTVEVDGQPPTSGPAAGAWLVERLRGAHVAAVDADADAAAVQVVTAGGGRLILRLYGDPDTPDRVVVQGDR